MRTEFVLNPVCTTIPGTDNLQDYNIVSYTMLGNKRYVRYNHGSWYLDMVMNDEGYTKFEFGDEFFLPVADLFHPAEEEAQHLRLIGPLQAADELAVVPHPFHAVGAVLDLAEREHAARHGEALELQLGKAL